MNPLQSNFENFVNRFSKVQTSTTLPNPEPIQHSLKSNGLIKAFAVCTNQGLVRNYNEDRITTMVNIVKPMNKYFNEKWPNCSIFGIFDGHGGARCADFLKDNLHHYVILNQKLISNIYIDCQKPLFSSPACRSFEGSLF